MSTTCPHCNEKAMSLLKKAFLGPSRTPLCQHCEGSVKVSQLHSAVLIAPLVILIVLLSVAGLSLSPPLVVLLVIVELVLYIWWVPLVPGEDG